MIGAVKSSDLVWRSNGSHEQQLHGHRTIPTTAAMNPYYNPSTTDTPIFLCGSMLIMPLHGSR